MKMSYLWTKGQAIGLVICTQITQTGIDRFLIADSNIMQMSQFWLERQAIALAVCSRIIHIEIDRCFLHIEK